MTYTILDVIPDSDEWYARRREGLGASDSAAVLGLSKWATPLTVYMEKLGVARDFDPMLAWTGHHHERTIADWVTDFHPEVGTLFDGFAAQSDEWEWLFATPDRVVHTEDAAIPVELKSSMEYARDNWLDAQGAPAVPLYYQVQAQQQIAVLDAPYGWLAVMHGGRDFELYRIERDEEFIAQLVEKTRIFWQRHVLALTPPDPSTYAEALDAYPGVDDLEYELSETEYANLVQRDVDASDMNHTKKRVEAFRDYIAPAVGDATVLTYQGQPGWTYKRQNGAPNISDAERLRTEWPDAWDACVTVPRFPVLRRVNVKEESE